jgi:hypothetical protein
MFDSIRRFTRFARPSRRRSARFAAAFAALAAGTGAARADAPALVAGMLTCTAPAGHSFVVGSRYAVDCVFARAGAASERYVGEIQRVGLDLGFSGGAQLAWVVIASTMRPADSLAGSYIGASVGAAPGLGAGVNVLVGGSDRTISLQPVSAELKAGLSLAVGVAALTLRRP